MMVWQLIWKEGREHFWKMAALLGMVAALLAVNWWKVEHQPGERGHTEIFMELLLAGCCLVPIWVAAWTVTGEQRARGMLAGLPMNGWTAFAAKSAWGLATILLPVLAGMAGARILGWQVERDNALAGLMYAASLYLMIVAITAGIRREGTAAMAGLLVVLVSGIWAGTAVELPVPIARWLMAPNPFFALWSMDEWDRFGFPVQGGMAVVWWVIAARRCGRQGRQADQVVAAEVSSKRWKRIEPARFPLGATVWREWREQRLLVMGAGVVAVGMAALGGVASGVASGTAFETWRFVDLLAMLALATPTVVAVMLGVGSMSRDLEPGLMVFWRSRPMGAGAFFWSKYFVALGGIWLLLLVLTGAAIWGGYTWGVINSDTTGVLGWVALMALVGWLPLALTVTMFFYVIIRRTIYTVVLAVVTLTGMLNIPIWIMEWLGRSWGDASLKLFVVAGGFVAVGLVVLTKVALERDWKVRG